MKRSILLRFYLTLFTAFASGLALRAQDAPDKAPVLAAVNSVRFDGSNAQDPWRASWYETTVEVLVKPDKPQGTNRHVNNVRVTLNLGFDWTNEEGKPDFKFYRASAEAISIKEGRAFFRFYLPPEIVGRDAISGPAKYYTVDIQAAGKQQAPSRQSASTSITTPEALQGFLSKVASEAVSNDGILQPQYLTPFAWDSRRPAPTFLLPAR